MHLFLALIVAILLLKMIGWVIRSDNLVAEHLAHQGVRVRRLRRKHDRTRCNIMEAVTRRNPCKWIINYTVTLNLLQVLYLNML
jgi:hypothetical protein